MKFLRTFVFLSVSLTLVILGLANRQLVTLKILPFDTASLFGSHFEIRMPMFLVILIGILVGLLIGLLWEYLRMAKYRHAVARNDKALQSARRELQQVKHKKSKDQEDQDDILALLDHNNSN